jgi:cell division inhibitor SepF
MAGVWRKTMKYLGLVEEDEFDEVNEAGSMATATDEAEPSQGPPAGGPSRRLRRAEPATGPMPDSPDSLIRTIPRSRPTSGTIHRAEPKRFNEARELGERFKDGVPVIMNLQQTDDPIARRLVDFASGLVFAHDGKIELVANRVYLLTPADVEVSAEERERLREGGFYNQF